MDSLASYLTAAKRVIIAVGTAITTFLGGWDMALKVLVIFVVCDYLTGLVAAWYQGELNSNTGFKGIAKKILLFVPIAVAYWLDQVTGQDILRSLAIWFYIANEGLSILENLGRAGVSIPVPLHEALEQLKNKGSGAK
ncbi:phage holin family protein [Desulfallas thermosapovorans]|uniref:Holin, Cph1 family n=1 Tax=Desulfallas thermosapovorans DSM 6562 TaxID=1121431 RepID=A0A5S4ZR01_9FIRM|nr:phage holin family protein [Desulfallas thermosapovorans]TYO95130.1 holin, Cph1 family [Desulfallas thermosapovorans DSM 6562]